MPIASRTSVSWPMNKRPPASIVTSRARGIRDAALAANRYGARRSERGPCSGVEPEVADRVESVMPAQGITPGARVCHDAQTDEHLRVDFVYPDARPRPLALEVTAIVASVAMRQAPERQSRSPSDYEGCRGGGPGLLIRRC